MAPWLRPQFDTGFLQTIAADMPHFASSNWPITTVDDDFETGIDLAASLDLDQSPRIPIDWLLALTKHTQVHTPLVTTSHDLDCESRSINLVSYWNIHSNWLIKSKLKDGGQNWLINR